MEKLANRSSCLGYLLFLRSSPPLPLHLWALSLELRHCKVFNHLWKDTFPMPIFEKHRRFCLHISKILKRQSGYLPKKHRDSKKWKNFFSMYSLNTTQKDTASRKRGSWKEAVKNKGKTERPAYIVKTVTKAGNSSPNCGKTQIRQGKSSRKVSPVSRGRVKRWRLERKSWMIMNPGTG